MKVEDVELVRPPMQLVQHGKMGGEVGFQWVRVEPDGLVAHGHELGLRPGLGACEQHHIWPSSTSASVRWATILSVPP